MNLITSHKEIIKFILIFIFFIIYLKFSINLANYIDRIEEELKNVNDCSDDEWKDTHN